jgi:tetratricopeptide (TPR) repeat protein
VKRIILALLRVVYLVAVVGSAVYLGVHFAERTPWYKEAVYHRLFAGSEKERLRAASMLVQLGGERQLLAGIKVDAAPTRAVARKALEFMWFNAAGPEARRQAEEAYAAAEDEQFQQALIILDRLIEKFPKFAEAWNQRASVYWRLGEIDKSLADSRRALVLNPRHYGALQGVGACQMKLGHPQEALHFFRAALDLRPHDDATREALKDCEELLNKKQPASDPKTAPVLERSREFAWLFL